MRGPYHRALLGFLLSRWAEKTFTQESLALAMGKDQTSIGKYLKDKAGPLDLDDADAALTHAGSSLKAFIADQANAIIRPIAPLSPVAKKLWMMLQAMPDDELTIFLGLARSARSLSSRRTGTRSARTRAADQSRTVRKTGGTR